MAFVVLYDACVLYPAPLRDLLIRLANTGIVRARWSATIDLGPGLVTAVVGQQAKALKSPPRSVGELLDTLRDQGLVRSVAKLRELLGASDPT